MSDRKTSNIASSIDAPQAKSQKLIVQESGDELVVYDLRTDKAMCLNQTAALVWQSCDGKSRVPQIARKLEEKTGSPVAEEVVWFALDQLGQEGLLIHKGTPIDRFKGMSRRDIFKRVAMASALAVPMISSLVAPEPAAAQSGGCVNPGGALPGTIVTTSACPAPECPFCQSNKGLCCSNIIFSDPVPNGNTPGTCNTSIAGCSCTCV